MRGSSRSRWTRRARPTSRGFTYSTDFPTESPYQATPGELDDVFRDQAVAGGQRAGLLHLPGRKRRRQRLRHRRGHLGERLRHWLHSSTDFPTRTPTRWISRGDAFVTKSGTPPAQHYFTLHPVGCRYAERGGCSGGRGPRARPELHGSGRMRVSANAKGGIHRLDGDRATTAGDVELYPADPVVVSDISTSPANTSEQRHRQAQQLRRFGRPLRPGVRPCSLPPRREWLLWVGRCPTPFRTAALQHRRRAGQHCRDSRSWRPPIEPIEESQTPRTSSRLVAFVGAMAVSLWGVARSFADRLHQRGRHLYGQFGELEPDHRAISVITGAPVIIEDCSITSAGDDIASTLDANVTVRNCRGQALIQTLLRYP